MVNKKKIHKYNYKLSFVFWDTPIFFKNMHVSGKKTDNIILIRESFNQYSKNKLLHVCVKSLGYIRCTSWYARVLALVH